MFGIFFTEKQEITSYAEVMKCDTEKFKIFFHKMLEQGVYLAPSAFEAGFMSLATPMNDIERTLSAADIAFQRLLSVKKCGVVPPHFGL